VRWKASWSDESAVFDETAKEEDLGGSERGERAAMSVPQRATTEGVRDDIASSAGGEKRPRREATRGGVDDRDPTRTVRRRARELVGESLRQHARSATIVEAGGSPSSASPPGRLIRCARGRLPTSRRRLPSRAPRVSQHASYGTSQEVSWHERAPGIGQSVGTRELKSVADVGETHLSRCSRGFRCRRRHGRPHGARGSSTRPCQPLTRQGSAT